jgi:cytochrome c peroxidase
MKTMGFLIIFCLVNTCFGDVFEASYKLTKQNRDKFKLGRMLFFDKILSGNKNISCATCHNPIIFTSDALSLPVGEGGKGLGTTRNPGNIKARVPRNSPSLFNLGGPDFTSLFHDGRVEVNEKFPSGIKSPMGMDLPRGLTGTLAAQALFPLLSDGEMAGHKGENIIADAVAEGRNIEAWKLIVDRLRNIPEYVRRFKEAYSPDIVGIEDMNIVQVANALAIFQSQAFYTLNSPFDQYQYGNKATVSDSAKRGGELFKGKAKCITCHGGQLQTDHKFYSIAMPPIGPGKGDGEKGYDDFGREKVTGDKKDRYKFRTPSLRNVALTGPWGHNGAYGKLEDIVLHHIYPEKMLKNYTIDKAYLPTRADLDSSDIEALKDPKIIEDLLISNELPKVTLNDREITDLINFLHCLTDFSVYDLHRIVPKKVPSGLPLAD